MKRKKGAASILFMSLLMLCACSKNLDSKSESTVTPVNTEPNNRSNVESKSESTSNPTSTEPDNHSTVESKSDLSTGTTNTDSVNRSNVEFPPDFSTDTTHERFNNSSREEAMFVINGVQINIDPSMGSEDNNQTHRYHSSITINSQTSSQSSTSSSKINVNGRQVEVVNGDLRINGRSYGQVKSGDKVLIAAKGVQVNGKERGS
jgi:hypothetical protein